MKERLLKAYFEQGRHIGRIEDLASLAAEVGLDADEARTVLENGDFADDVEQDIAQARAYGISGVPFFVFNGRYGVSGRRSPRPSVRSSTRSSRTRRSRWPDHARVSGRARLPPGKRPRSQQER
ncbi:DsbA family protein [Oerskovia sp. M15]